MAIYDVLSVHDRETLTKYVFICNMQILIAAHTERMREGETERARERENLTKGLPCLINKNHGRSVFKCFGTEAKKD